VFSPKTVFIVGAGASCDFGFPTGDGLRLAIANVLQRLLVQPLSLDDPFLRAVHEVYVAAGTNDELDELRRAAHRLLAALPLAISIDNLLHAHRQDKRMVLLGKLAICAVIIAKERSSPLFLQDHQRVGDVQHALMELQSFTDSWYLPLVRLLAMGKDLNQLDSVFENTAFIVWNYDRCLEHFLVNAIMRYFNVEASRAAQIINDVTIVHPYGKAGKLPWEDGDTPVAGYGDRRPPLRSIAASILTFTESADEGVRENAVNLVEGAETLVFMGFGFLPQNTKLLTTEATSSVKRVFATTYGIGDDDVGIIKREVGEMIKRDVWYQGKLRSTGLKALDQRPDFHFYAERGTCRDLMDHNWLRLTRD
jgi:hypothetical protein